MDHGDRQLRISGLKVAGLFGMYDHEVPLNYSERVTLIHGPNGVGKTTLLRMAAHFFRGHYHLLAKIPFSSFTIAFSDEAAAQIKHSRKQQQSYLDISWRGEKANIAVDLNIEARVAKLAASVHHISRVDQSTYYDLSTSEQLTALEVYNRYIEPTAPTAKDEASWLRSLRQRVTVHFIEAQRLVRLESGRRGEKATATVTEQSSDLRKRISETLTRYAVRSQISDQSFPQRLLSSTQDGFWTKSREQITRELDDLEARSRLLQSLGLMDQSNPIRLDPLQIQRFQEYQLSVLALYIDDTKEKLDVFSALSRRIELLLQIVNNKLLNKSIRTNKEKGLVAVGDNESEIAVEDLSSGEQHQLVMLYELLFRVDKNCLILIDEPELSLHVTWQKSFLDDIIEIARESQFDAIIATHSPYIVNNRYDLMVALGEERS